MRIRFTSSPGSGHVRPLLLAAGLVALLSATACTPPPTSPPATTTTTTTTTIPAVDTTPPVLRSLVVTTPTVDSSGGPATVTITLRVTDDLSGLNGTAVSFVSPSGTQVISFNLSGGVCATGTFTGPSTDRTLTCSATIPKFSEHGTWAFQSAIFVDVAGNPKFLSPSDLAALGITPPTFDQVGVGDATPPLLKSLVVTTPTVDSSAGPATVTVSLRVTDDLSGTQYGSVTFISPAGGQTLTITFDVSGCVGLSTGTSTGTPTDRTVTCSATIPQFARQGTWTLQSADLIDVVGNTSQLGPSGVAALGITPPTFSQIGAGDVTPPVLKSLVVTTPTVDSTAAPATVTATFRVTDDLSGVRGGFINFESPSHHQILSIDFEGTRCASSSTGSSTDFTTDVTLTCSATLPPAPEEGTWTLLGATFLDALNNSITLQPADLTAASITPPTFTNVG